MSNRYEGFPTKLFIDTNVVFQCKALSELPWAELELPGPILLLLLPQVLREINSKKQDGRLGKRARHFARLCIPLTESDTPVEVGSGAVRVAMAAADCAKIPWSDYTDLDADDPDYLIVAQALHVRGVNVGEAFFTSHDTLALMRARQQGLKLCRVPDTWLRSADPHPFESKVATLQQELNILRKSAPEFSIDVEIADGPYEIFKVEPLSDVEHSDYADAVLNRFPLEVQDKQSFGLRGPYDYEYDKKYEKFRDTAVPRFARVLHGKLELQFNQIPLTITVTNDGEVMGLDVQLTFRVSGGWVNDHPILASRWPSAPVIDQIGALSRSYFPAAHVADPNRIRRAVDASLDLGSLRHEHQFTWSGVVWLDSRSPGSSHIELRVTASNLTGSKKKSIPFSTRTISVAAAELVDLDDLTLLRKSRLDHIFTEARRKRNFDGIEIDKDPEEDR